MVGHLLSRTWQQCYGFRLVSVFILLVRSFKDAFCFQILSIISLKTDYFVMPLSSEFSSDWWIPGFALCNCWAGRCSWKLKCSQRQRQAAWMVEAAKCGVGMHCKHNGEWYQSPCLTVGDTLGRSGPCGLREYEGLCPKAKWRLLSWRLLWRNVGLEWPALFFFFFYFIFCFDASLLIVNLCNFLQMCKPNETSLS